MIASYKNITWIKLFVSGLFLLTSNTIFSQGNDRDKFNELYYESLGRTKNLYSSKGMIKESEYDYRERYDYAREFSEFLNNYKQKKNYTGVLFYFYTKDSLQIWLLARDHFYHSATRISKDSLLMVELDLRKALKVDQLATSRMPVKRGIKPDTISTKNLKTIQQAIHIASTLLFPEIVAKEIKELEHIMILPELNIGRFPFYVLSPYHNDIPLIDKSSVSFIPRLINPSQALLRDYDKMGVPYSEIFSSPLVVGNPEYTTANDYILPQLPGAAKEAAEVADLLQCKCYTGKQASISTIKQLAENADLLYFATHGVFDMEKMLDGSFIAFTPDSNDKSGLWTAKNIQQSHLSAKMAVLSACQTGIGKIYDGGFLSIGQSFLIAGVPHTINSLWSVDDASTKKLMLLFMQEMKKPDYYYPAGQLRKAILEYRKNDKKLAHWAPFTVFGFTY